MDSFGSDRKLSELGLDIPDFLDPVIDPAELFPTVHHTMVVSDPVDAVTERYRHNSNRQQQQQPNNNSRIYVQAECSTSSVSLVNTTITTASRMTMKKNDVPYNFRRRFQCTTNSSTDVDEEYEEEFKLIDVVDDDDEVVLDSGWLDDILDNERQSSHMTCTNDDVIGQQHVSDEHSYSLANGTNDLGFTIKMESDEIDMDAGIFEMINPDLTLITSSDVPSSMGNCSEDYGIISTEATADFQDPNENSTCYSMIKNEPLDASVADSAYPFSPVQSGLFDVTDSVDLPLTPPSSSGSSSDSETGGLSPRNSPPSSPFHVTSSPPMSRTHQMNSSGSCHHGHGQQTTVGSQQSVWTASVSSSQQPFFANPLPSSGILILSEEEKRTLVAEGYPIPSKLPLTKQEEKNLKKIRRKIKNKISAQESRRKKKEYLETLEKKVETVSIENINLKKRVDLLESNNRSLISQLQKLQSMHKLSASMQSAACITVN